MYRSLSLAVLLLALLGCNRPAPETAGVSTALQPVDDVPVILISLDTLRADRLSSYGYTRETTPNLDRFAREDAVLFEQAVTPETWTLPSHMSMFTGLYPQHHAVTRDKPLAQEIRTLPELLKSAGYETAGFTGHTWWMQPERGFGRGMDHYDNAPEMLRHIADTQERLHAWLDQRSSHMPFIFFHAYDLHYKIRENGYDLPYEPGRGAPLTFAQPYLDQGAFQEGEKANLKASELLKAAREGRITFDQNEKDALQALYDDTLHMVDAAIGQFLERLKEKELYDNALIIVTSDHGEGLGERGYYDHEDVWEEEARIPLLVKFPGNAHAGKRVAHQVQLVDLFPTVAEVLGLPLPEKMDGKSLLKSLEAQVHAHAYIRNGARSLAVRTPKWKLHWRPQGQNEYLLFNLEDDPGELNSQLLDAPIPAKQLREEAHRFFSLAQAGWHLEVLAPRDGAWRATLKATVTPAVEYAFLFDLWGNVHILHAREPGVFEVTLGGAVPEHLVIPAREAGTLTLSLDANTSFGMRFEGYQEEAVTTQSHTLHAGTHTYARQEAPVELGQPHLSLWYIRGQAGAASETLSPELEDQLRALGYLKE